MKGIYFDTPKQQYRVGDLEDLKTGQFAVCTEKHFVHEVCKFFEQIHPNIESNPMYQKKGLKSDE